MKDPSPVSSKVENRNVVYYPLTQHEIRSLGTTTAASDTLFGLGSISVGAGLSISSADAKWVLLFIGSMLIVFSLIFRYLNWRLIKDIEKSAEPLKTDKQTISKETTSSFVIRAEYGAGAIWIDITDRLVNARVVGGPVTVSNELAGGDPIPGVVKSLRVLYNYNSEQFSKSFPEGTNVELPFID